MAKKTAPKRVPAPAPTKAKQHPFITADDLTGRTVFQIEPSITVFVHDNKQVSLFITIKNKAGEFFTWGPRCTSPDRISLQKKLGRNMVEWPGKKIELYPARGSQGGRFVNIFDEERIQQNAVAEREPGDDDIPF